MMVIGRPTAMLSVCGSQPTGSLINHPNQYGYDHNYLTGYKWYVYFKLSHHFTPEINISIVNLILITCLLTSWRH